MAKKKKATPSNACRGYATTSAPSKKQPTDVPEDSEIVSQNNGPKPETSAETKPKSEPKLDTKSELKSLFILAAKKALAETAKRESLDSLCRTPRWLRLDAESEARLQHVVNSDDAWTNACVSAPEKEPLLVLYLGLEQAGFASSDIELAIRESRALDLTNALNWLCIHLDPDRLPAKFTNGLTSNSDTPISVVISTASHPQRSIEKSLPYDITAVNNSLQPKHTARRNLSDDSHDTLKRRTLQYMAVDDSESDQSGDEIPPTPLSNIEQHSLLKHRLELLKNCLLPQCQLLRIQPPPLLLTSIRNTSTALINLEKDRSFSKRKAEVEYARRLQASIGYKQKYQTHDGAGISNDHFEAIEIKLHAEDKLFYKTWIEIRSAIDKAAELKENTTSNEINLGESVNYQLKKSAAESMEQESGALDDDSDDDAFGAMFDQQDTESLSVSTTQSTSILNVLDLMIPASWTGRTPRQILPEYAKRVIATSRPNLFKVSYEVDQQLSGTGSSRGLFRSKVKLVGDISLEQAMPQNTFAQTKSAADDYVSVLALFQLLEMDSKASALLSQVYTLFPPMYQDIWKTLVESKKVAVETLERVEQNRKMQFIDSVIESRGLLVRNQAKRAINTGNEKKNTFTDGRGSRTTVTLKKFTECRKQFLSRQSNESFRVLQEFRNSLPAYGVKDEFLEILRMHQIIIICGETGSGKSTQIPQYILREALESDDCNIPVNIICTQPRRISATSIAVRVSQEMGDSPGFPKGSLVGYSVKMDTKLNDSTMLSFQTVGVLLRMMDVDPLLTGVTHVIVDEVHERGLDSDFLVLRLRRLLRIRRDLKVVLMSATADAEKFANYFENFLGTITTACPILNIPGRTFPVNVFYLEDAIEACQYVLEPDSEFAVRTRSESGADYVQYQARDTKYSETTYNTIQRMNPTRGVNLDLIETLIRHLVNTESTNHASTESILVFLPGLAEIRNLYERLTSSGLYVNKNSRPMTVLPLHSVLSSAEQGNVFQPAPKGSRKIVLSTNIAETGITIPDVVYVIDTCRAREVWFDKKRGMKVLGEVPVSKANCRQRRGRAGRVKEGVCFHLVTMDEFDGLSDHRPPEMLRLQLEELLLRALVSGIEPDIEGVRTLFTEAIDPPPLKNVDAAIKSLTQIQALSPKGTLTPLGRKLAPLPVDIRLGKMLVYAVLMKTLDSVLTIVSALSLGKDIFVDSGFDNIGDCGGSRAGKFSTDSDLKAISKAYEGWRNYILQTSGNKWSYSKQYCNRHGLSLPNLLLIEESRLHMIQSLTMNGVLESNWVGVVNKSMKPLLTSLSKDANMNAESLTSAVLAFAIFPTFLEYVTHEKSNKACFRMLNTTQEIVHVPGKSVVRSAVLAEGAIFATYGIQRSQGTKIVAMDLTKLSISMALLSSGGAVPEHLSRCLKGVSGDLFVRCAPKTASIVSTFLNKLSQSLNRGIENMGCNSTTAVHEQNELNSMISVWIDVLERKGCRDF